MKVLVVDDDVMQLRLVKRMLVSTQCEVRVTSSPIGVTNIVRVFEPDVVLLDVNIPGLSGDRLLTLLRDKSESRLVLFSASDPDVLRKLAEEVGADAWIAKGVTAESLMKKLRAICGKRD